MAKLRSVSTAFWSDPFIEELTPSEKLLYIYFITNEKTNMLGIYELSIKKICFETGLNKETVQKSLETFQRLNKIKYSKNFIILINFIKHQNYNTNMKKAAIQTYLNLPNELKVSDLTINESNPLESFETLSNHLGMVRKYEYEYEEEIELEKEVKKEVKEVYITPTIEEVIDYFKFNGYTRSAAKKAFNYYNENNWKDSQGRKVISWKQKMQGVWFKDENKDKAKEKPVIW